MSIPTPFISVFLHFLSYSHQTYFSMIQSDGVAVDENEIIFLSDVQNSAIHQVVIPSQKSGEEQQHHIIMESREFLRWPSGIQVFDDFLYFSCPALHLQFEPAYIPQTQLPSPSNSPPSIISFFSSQGHWENIAPFFIFRFNKSSLTIPNNNNNNKETIK